MDNRVRQDASVRTARRSVSVIMEEAVLRPLDSVCVAQDTQERGQYMHRKTSGFTAVKISNTMLSTRRC